MHNFLVYWISLYMFRKVFPSIIRSSRLYTQHQVYVIQVSWQPASKQSTNLYDIHMMLCVQSWTPDDGRKDRPKHVEWYSINLKIVHLIRDGTAFHLVPTSKESSNLYDIYMMLCVRSWTPEDGRKDRSKHVEWYSVN